MPSFGYPNCVILATVLFMFTCLGTCFKQQIRFATEQFVDNFTALDLSEQAYHSLGVKTYRSTFKDNGDTKCYVFGT